MIKQVFSSLQHLRHQLFIVEHSGTNALPLQKDLRPPTLFVFLIISYLLYMVAMQPNWVLGGEMWAESAFNYYPVANSPSYFDKLFTLDVGYIPLPPRLVAWIGNALNLPASSIPYFYTWSGMIIMALLVGSFCLSPFRLLIKSDLLRFLTAVTILLILDFETRSFPNMAYPAAFFIAILTALALVDDSKEVPRWAWFIPILIVSKACVLSALPAMILVAIVSKSRFRWISIVTTLACLVQILRLAVSRSEGRYGIPPEDFTFLTKLINAFKYFFGMLGTYIAGPNFHLGPFTFILIGFLGFLFCCFVIVKKKSSAGSLIFTGLSLLFFNAFILTFTFSQQWNGSMSALGAHALYRHTLVSFFGFVLVIAALCAILAKEMVPKSFSRLYSLRPPSIGAILFTFWFIGAGWGSFSQLRNKDPLPPFVGNSQWQKMATAIDSSSPVCVPIDPWWKGWTRGFFRNCHIINRDETLPLWDNGTYISHYPSSLDITPPENQLEHTLISTAILVKPFSAQKTFISAQMAITLKDGKIIYYSGDRELQPYGGMILLTGKENLLLKNIASIKLNLNVPVEIALGIPEALKGPGIVWMGY